MNPQWGPILKQLVDGRDKVPVWSPSKTPEKDVETWKHKSSKRTGQTEVLKYLGYED